MAAPPPPVRETVDEVATAKDKARKKKAYSSTLVSRPDRQGGGGATMGTKTLLG